MVVADIGLVHELGEARHADVVGCRLRNRLAVEYPVDAVARQVFRRAETGDLLDDVGDECIGVTVGSDGNGERRRSTEGAPRRPPQPAEDPSRHVEHDLRRRGHELFEHRRRERRQGRVAYCPYRRRTRSTVEQAELTDHVATAEFGDQTFAVVAVVDQHRQPASDDEIGGIRDVALAEEGVTGFEPTPRHTIDHLLDEIVVAVAHQLGHHRGHVRAVDALAGLVGHGVGHLGVAVQPRLELGPFDLEHLDRSARPQGGSAQAAGDHGDLADHLAGFDGADVDLALRGRLRRSHRSRLDEVDVVGGVALFDEDVTIGERQRAGLRAQTLDQCRCDGHPPPLPSAVHPLTHRGRQ